MSSVVASSLKAASLNMVTSVAFRLVTFAMNAFVLRHVSGDVLGLINVRLNLLDDTIMFLSREGFRLACLGHSGKEGWQKMINLLWLPVLLAMFWSSTLSWVWVSLLPAPANYLQSQYSRAVVLVGLSGVWQMVVEPAWVSGQLLMFVRLRVALDTVWVMTRVLVLCLAVHYTPDRVVEVWAWGHVLACLLYVLGYYLAFYVIIRVNNSHRSSHQTTFPFTGMRGLLPSLSCWEVDQNQWRIATSFLGQGVVKQLLTEGEKYVMTIFSLLTLSEQGVYDVVANLGSLAARFVLRPVEESAYFFFSQLWKRSLPVDQQDQDDRDKVTTGLFRLLRLALFLGLMVVSLGYSFSHLLLHLYGGLTLTAGVGPDLLRAQCLLILFLSVNGITECFARAAMSESEISSYTRAMSVMSAVYLALAWLLTKLLGPVGFVMANCCNMLVRIVFSIRVIRRTFRDSSNSPLEGLTPDNDILLLFLSAGVCCQLSEIWIYPELPLVHLLLGVMVGVILVMAVVIKEDFILSFIVEKFRGSRGVSDLKERELQGDESQTEKSKME